MGWANVTALPIIFRNLFGGLFQFGFHYTVAGYPVYFGEVLLSLMDIQMPVMNGYEATRQIRALDDPGLSNIPVIAMTANAFKEDIEAAKDAGMDRHIAKPIDIGKLIETLNEILTVERICL